MNKTEFINKLFSKYYIDGVTLDEISEMLTKGFIHCNEVYLPSYLNDKDYFMDRYFKFKNNLEYLTASEFNAKAREQVPGFINLNVTDQELIKMAELGILPEKYFKKITLIAATKPEEGGSYE